MGVSILWFILILSVLVISHEMGHFLLAKLHGIRVVEFFVGFGPTLLSFTKNGTKFSLKLLPFGGACVFDGQDGLDTDAVLDEHSFPNANVWHRISTVLAGPVFNILLAMIFSMVIVRFCGSDLPVIENLTPGRPALESGLSVGDTISKINGEKIHIWRDITLISILNDGEPLEVEYIHNGAKETTTIYPAYEPDEDRYYIGIEGGTTFIDCKGLKLFEYSYYELVFNFRNTLKSLKSLLFGKLGMDAVSGPVGIAQAVDENYDMAKEYGTFSVILTMMNIAMLLSVNLGVLNLLPLPALDGGRFIFLLIEVVRGKPIPREKEGIVHLVGIVLLFLLAVVVLFNDVVRWVGR